MDGAVIDMVCRMIVERDLLPGIPQWPVLKDYLVQFSMMDPVRLEERRPEIVGRFIRCREEQTEEARNALLGVTPNRTTSALPDEGYMSPASPGSVGSGQNQDQTRKAESSREEEMDEETFQPQIDEKLTQEASCFMSICLASNGRWEGAALKYCTEAESFVSHKIVERHRLGKYIAEDDRIKLTWRLCDEEESNVTQFLVLKNLDCDFVLGTRCRDKEFNHDEDCGDHEDVESESNSSTSSGEQLPSSLPQAYSLSDHLNTAHVGNLVKMIAHANAESILVLDQKFREMGMSSPPRLTMEPPRLPVEEVQSEPSTAHSSSARDRRSKKGSSKVPSTVQRSKKRHSAGK